MYTSGKKIEILIWRSVPLSLGEAVISVTWFFISEMRRLWIVWVRLLRVLSRSSCCLSGMVTIQSSLTAHSRRGIHGMTGTTQSCDWTGVNRWENHIPFHLPSFSLPMSSVAQMALFCPSNTKVFLPKEARSSNLRSDVPCVVCGMGCLGVIKAMYCKSQSSVL